MLRSPDDGVSFHSTDHAFLFFFSPGKRAEDTRPRELVVQEQLLLTLESAYPNIMPAEDLAQ